MVKRLVILLCCLVLLPGLGGCESAGIESAFLTEFSIGSIIKANEQYLIAPHTVSSGTVSEPPVPFFQKHEEAIVQIDASRIEAFMEAVRSDIEQALTSSGAEIRGRGGDHPELIQQALASQGLEGRRREGARQGQASEAAGIAGFSFRYSDGNAEGAINVWGVRGQGTTLFLIVLITESRGA
ncbi:MAG: hypothetical protein JSV36_12990 [Anaerolineae bacterium]|nr:MAG: hypothetical protein JSV36_12990 [Anaerolineae bacterium]